MSLVQLKNYYKLTSILDNEFKSFINTVEERGVELILTGQQIEMYLDKESNVYRIKNNVTGARSKKSKVTVVY